MAVNGDTGEVIEEKNKLAVAVERALNAFDASYREDGTYEDMYFRLDSATSELIKNIRRALFKYGTM